MAKNLFISNFKKLPLAFLIFLLIFTLGECLISHTSNFIITQRAKLNIFKEVTKAEKINIVIIGHSAVEVGVQSSLLAEILSKSSKKIKCFNLSSGSLPIGTSYFIFKNIIAPKKPSLIIFGFWGDSFDDYHIDNFDTYHTMRDYIKFSDMPTLFKISLTSSSERIDLILRKLSYSYSYKHIIRLGLNLLFRKIKTQHKFPVDYIKSRLKHSRRIREISGDRPISSIDSLLIEEGADIAKNVFSDATEEKKLSKNYYYLNKIIFLCGVKNIKLLFIIMPRLNENILPEETKTFLKKHNVKFLDFSNKHKYDKYFLDKMHLNEKGSEILTKDIANFLLENRELYF